MSESEIQRRFTRGELVFTDGRYVFMRVKNMGYRRNPWHYTDPIISLFDGGRDDVIYSLMEFCDCHWWTAEHGQQLIKALATLGVALTPKVVEMLEWRQDRRAGR